MNNKGQKQKYRVVSFLKREELDFLDTLEKDIYFSSGIHVPRAKLIEEIIEAFRNKQNKESIEQELIEKFRK